MSEEQSVKEVVAMCDRLWKFWDSRNVPVELIGVVMTTVLCEAIERVEDRGRRKFIVDRTCAILQTTIEDKVTH